MNPSQVSTQQVARVEQDAGQHFSTDLRLQQSNTHITSHDMTSHNVTSCRVTSHHVTSYHVSSHHVMSHLVTSGHVMSHHITPSHITCLHWSEGHTDSSIRSAECQPGSDYFKRLCNYICTFISMALTTSDDLTQ